ncbi:MAG TPA: SEC-C metal-binding domain-containing protein [Verrucomicrobiae bacterium]
MPICIFSRRLPRGFNRNPQPGGRIANHADQSPDSNFEITSKRRKGFPSETRVKRGRQIVHGDKELCEKLGRNDLCPCGSGLRF